MSERDLLRMPAEVRRFGGLQSGPSEGLTAYEADRHVAVADLSPDLHHLRALPRVVVVGTSG